MLGGVHLDYPDEVFWHDDPVHVEFEISKEPLLVVEDSMVQIWDEGC